MNVTLMTKTANTSYLKNQNALSFRARRDWNDSKDSVYTRGRSLFPHENQCSNTYTYVVVGNGGLRRLEPIYDAYFEKEFCSGSTGKGEK